MFEYQHLITKLLSFTQRLGNSLRTLNTLSQEPDLLDQRVIIQTRGSKYWTPKCWRLLNNRVFVQYSIPDRNLDVFNAFLDVLCLVFSCHLNIRPFDKQTHFYHSQYRISPVLGYQLFIWTSQHMYRLLSTADILLHLCAPVKICSPAIQARCCLQMMSEVKIRSLQLVTVIHPPNSRNASLYTLLKQISFVAGQRAGSQTN